MKLNTYFLTHETGVFSPVGISMLPLIRPKKDTVLLQKIETLPKKYDIVLYERNGKFILHRVIKVAENGYIFCGDGQWRKELVNASQLHAIAVKIYRKERQYDANHKLLQVYAFLWCFCPIMRIPFIMAGKMLRKLLRQHRAKCV